MTEDTPERGACVALAEDYDELAALLKRRLACSQPLIVRPGNG
jgi:hypothetical protein